MLKNYELLYIVHPDLEGSIEKVTEKVAGFIVKTKGEIVSQEEWGKKKLAYPIAKNNFGIYVLVNFITDSIKLCEVERDLRLSEEIIRSMIVIEPEKKEIEKEPRVKKTKTEEAPASIIVNEEAPTVEKAGESETKKEIITATEEKPKETVRKKKEVVAVTENAKEPTEENKAEAEKKRKEILDEKLDEILGKNSKKA